MPKLRNPQNCFVSARFRWSKAHIYGVKKVMQHWNVLLSWNSETVQIFSKHIHILQGLLKLIHNSNQSHLMPTLRKKGYTNLFLPSKINVWKSQAVLYWPRQEGCSYVFGGKKLIGGQISPLFLFIHRFHLGYEIITVENPFLTRSDPGAQQWRPKLPKCFSFK